MSITRKDIIEYQSNINCPLILDGAVGSLLQQRGITIDRILWSSYANVVAPLKVIKVHREYINAGADIITTNTFRTNPIAYNKSSLNITNEKFVEQSVSLALEAKKGSTKILIAGSNPPAEDSYQDFRKVSIKEIETNHMHHIDMLWENGVDFILNETQSHFDEIKIICEHCNNNNIPFILSLFATADGKILSGEPIDEVIKFVNAFNPIAIGVNCITPNIFNTIVGKISAVARYGFYLNCGSGNYTDAEIFEGVSPTDYIDAINIKYNTKPLFIGSCCGSTPAHTKAIKEFTIEHFGS